MDKLSNLRDKVERLNRVLQNTGVYRLSWKNGLKNFIQEKMKELGDQLGLTLDFEHRDQIHNLEALVIGMGKKDSGIAERLENDLVRPFIRHGGLLVYQQLFNGKILVMIHHPFIEGYGEPRPPRNIAIYRPEEISEESLIRHLDLFVSEIAEWEDYDDDDVSTKRIGFNMSYQTPDE